MDKNSLKEISSKINTNFEFIKSETNKENNV